MKMSQTDVLEIICQIIVQLAVYPLYNLAEVYAAKLCRKA